MLTQLNAWVAKMSLALSIPTKDELFMFQKTKIKFYIGKQKYAWLMKYMVIALHITTNERRQKVIYFQKIIIFHW